MAEITAASQEQSNGIEQVNQAIGQMDQVTQQNAALVEEAAAATESMQDQARALAEVVRVFKLDHRNLQAAAPAPAAKPQAKPAPKPQPTPAPKPQAKPAAALASPATRARATVAAGDWEEF
jgi:methyl-accepting chemotaxis protein